MYVVEYSKSQGSFHISTMQERMVNEARCILRGVQSDYKVIHECYTYEEALKFYDEKILVKQ